MRGELFAMTAKGSDALHMITSGIAAHRSTGSIWTVPTHLSFLARAYAEVGKFYDASRVLAKR